jgi:hypothetical protein
MIEGDGETIFTSGVTVTWFEQVVCGMNWAPPGRSNPKKARGNS